MDEGEGSVDAAVGASTGGVFVGRRRELQRLHSAIDGAVSRDGGIWLVLGEPGAGKTTIAEMASRHAAEQGAVVVWGRCWEGGGAPVYWPWVEFLRGYVAAAGEEALHEDAGDGLARLAALVPELSVAGRGAAVAGARRGDEHERFALFDAFGVFIRRAAERRPLVIVFDDLHAADAPSLLLLQFVARRLQQSRGLVIGTCRQRDPRRGQPAAELLARLARDSACLPLPGLSEAEIDELIGAAAGVHPEHLAREVRSRTNGNPFFVDEIVRLLVRQRALDVSRPGQGVPLPEAIKEAVRARLAALSDRARDVLTVAAVLGREITVHVLRHATELEPEPLLEALHECASADVLEDVTGSGNRYRFSHQIIRETLESEAPPVRRLQLHLRVAEALERVYGPESEPHVAELAHHFLASAALGGVERAVEYGLRAGDRAMRLLAFEDAAARFERVLLVLELDPSLDQRRRCDALLALGAAQRRAGELSRARESFVAAAELARDLADADRLARAALGYGGGLGGYGVVEQADEALILLLEEALDRMSGEDSVLRIRVQARLATELYFTGEVRRRDALSREAVEAAERLQDRQARLTALYSRHWAMLGPDGTRERLAAAGQIVRLAREAGDGEMLFHGHHFRLTTVLELGDMAGVDREIRACAELCNSLRQRFYRWQTVASQAMRALARGEFEEGGRLAADALALGRRAQPRMAAVVFGAQSLAHRWGLGRLEEVEPAVRGFADHYAWAPAWRAALVFLYAESGRSADGRSQFELLASRDFADIPRDGNWLMAHALLAVGAASLGDAERAARLYELLLPYADRTVDVAAGAVTVGLAGGYVGMLALALGRHDDAVTQCTLAAERNLAAGNRPFAARMMLEQVRALRARGAPGDHELARDVAVRGIAIAEDCGMAWLADRLRALTDDGLAEPAHDATAATAGDGVLVRREGEYWVIAYEGDEFRLRDSKGLRYLAELLASPGYEVAARSLASSATGERARLSEGGSALADQGLVSSGLGDAGAAIDGQARDAYRRRLDDLRDELEEAERFNDPERLARARAEFDFVACELAAAVGLSGRPRRLHDPDERARQSVTKAIRSAIDRISAHSPALGEHLAATVRTGTSCSYDPDRRAAVARRR
jgi:tetratricopeptide (TPR) repeat protein